MSIARENEKGKIFVFFEWGNLLRRSDFEKQLTNEEKYDILLMESERIPVGAIKTVAVASSFPRKSISFLPSSYRGR